MPRLNLKRLLAVGGLVAVGACSQAWASTGDVHAPTARHAAPTARHSARAAIDDPRTVQGNRPISLVASGLHTPTAFAFGDGQVFEGDYGSTQGHHLGGGVYLLAHGHARRLPDSPAHIFGLTWHHGWLYMSSTNQLLRWRDFNGVRFLVRQVIYTAPAGFVSFNGIGFGADGRLYAGTFDVLDNGPVSAPLARRILTFNANGSDMRVFATGIRQPWQMTFPAHSNVPYVSDLGQDFDVTNPPDFVLRVHRGDNYGFWRCNWTVGSPCGGYARPLIFLPPHYSPMGLTIVGKRLYINENGTGTLVSTNLGGGDLRPELRVFQSSPLGLASHDGWIYDGEMNGKIWRYRPGG